MLYAIRYHFGANIAEKRAAARPGHLDYLREAGDRLKLAGPLSNDDGEEADATGSLLVLDAGSLTAAQLFAQNDPYNKGGVVARIDISPFRAVLGQWTL